MQSQSLGRGALGSGNAEGTHSAQEAKALLRVGRTHADTGQLGVQGGTLLGEGTEAGTAWPMRMD